LSNSSGKRCRSKVCIGIRRRGHEATLANALTSAPAFGLKRDEAVALLEDLRVVVDAGWKSALTEAGLGSTDVERLESCFSEAQNAEWQS
jgi:hypothetical protein